MIRVVAAPTAPPNMAANTRKNWLLDVFSALPHEASVYRMTGVLVLDDRTVWIAEGSGYESQWYELFEIGPGNSPPHSVLSVPNGGF